MRALEVLKAINEARYIGQRDAADVLSEELEGIDRKGGYFPQQYPKHLVTEDKTQRAATRKANRDRFMGRRT